MAVIEECCKCMKAMIDDGTIQPDYRSGEVTNYNEIKYCPFCGKPIRLV
jgi:hypothetical protein